MVLAWYIDDKEGDPCGEHHLNPPQFVTTDALKDLTGVLLYNINLDECNDDTILKLKRERGYKYEDEIEIAEGKMQNYEEKMKGFSKEHLHLEEEIRLIIDGAAYFDVRDKHDRWIRLRATKGDLIVLPPGIFHRLAQDTQKYVKVRRFFKNEQVWTSINRSDNQ